MAPVRVPLEAGGGFDAPPLRRPAPAAPRLADVVRRARELRDEPLVHRVPLAPARARAVSPPATRERSVSSSAAAIRPGAALPVPVHGSGYAPLDRGLVAARAGRSLLPGAGGVS